MFGKGLFEGGKEALAKKDYKNAVTKLKEFTDRFKRDRRRDEGLYRLAFAYRGAGEHNSATKTMVAFTEQYLSLIHI